MLCPLPSMFDDDALSWKWIYSVNDGSEITLTSGTDTIEDISFDYSGISVPSTYEWILRVDDGTNTVEQRLTVVIIEQPSIPAPQNQSPVVNASSTTTSVMLPDTLKLNGSQTDDGLPDPPALVTLLWSKVSGPGTVTFADPNALSTTASFSVDGTYVLQLEADDGALQSTSSIIVTVNPAPPVNQTPIALDDNASTTEGTAVTINVLDNDTDANGDTLSITGITQGTNGTVAVNADNTVTYTPSTEFSGLDSFTYTAFDGITDSAIATVTINVRPLEWNVSIDLSGAQLKNLIVGMNKDGSDGYDSGLDRFAPFSGFQSAYAVLLNDSNSLHTNIRGISNFAIWTVFVDARSGIDCELSWTLDDVPADKLHLLKVDVNGNPVGNELPLDMSITNSYTVIAGGSGYFQIILDTRERFSFALPLQREWNLITIPIQPTDPTLKAVFGDVANSIWGFDSKSKLYFRPEIIEPKKGYWIFVNSDNAVLHLEGYAVIDTVMEFSPEWNLVGPVANPPYLPLEQPKMLTEGAKLELPYWIMKDGNYEMIEKNLASGSGYWIYTLTPCSVDLGPEKNSE